MIKILSSPGIGSIPVILRPLEFFPLADLEIRCHMLQAMIRACFHYKPDVDCSVILELISGIEDAASVISANNSKFPCKVFVRIHLQYPIVSCSTHHVDNNLQP